MDWILDLTCQCNLPNQSLSCLCHLFIAASNQIGYIRQVFIVQLLLPSTSGWLYTIFPLHFSPQNIVFNINDCGGLSTCTIADLNGFVNKLLRSFEYWHSETASVAPQYISGVCQCSSGDNRIQPIGSLRFIECLEWSTWPTSQQCGSDWINNYMKPPKPRSVS